MMKENNISAQLKDIKPLLEIPDISYYIYWSLIGFAILVGLIILFFVVKKLLSLRKINLNKISLQKLKDLEIKNSKEFAYSATLYARELSDIDEELSELFVKLEDNLSKYKYRKVVDEVDENTEELFSRYIEVANGKV